MSSFYSETYSGEKPIIFEISGYDNEDKFKNHRMFITKNLYELKNKVKETFGFKGDLKELYYFNENNRYDRKIYLKNEEDYQIMIMLLNKEKIIYLEFL